MGTFKEGNWNNPETVCPICKTQNEGEIVLVPIAGTKEGNLFQAIQVHTKCINENIVYYPENNVMIISTR